MNIIDDLDNSPEFKRVQNLRQIDFCLNIFYYNQNDLLEIVKYGTDPDNITELYVLEKELEKNEFTNRLIAKLHNFIASGYTLIDSTDTFIKKNYKGEKIEYEFKIKLEELFKDPYFNLHYHIRRYFQHFQVPDIIIDIEHKPESGRKIEILLSKQEFIKFIPKKDDKGRIQSASEYLEKLDSDINLYKFVIKYEVIIKMFFEWLYDKLKEIHKNDIATVNEKTNAIRKVWIPTSISGTIQIYKFGNMQPDSIFAGSIKPEKFKEISESKLPMNEKLKLYLTEIKDIELGENIIIQLKQIFQ